MYNCVPSWDIIMYHCASVISMYHVDYILCHSQIPFQLSSYRTQHIISWVVPPPSNSHHQDYYIRYHALRRLPQKVHLHISPNGIADICTREDPETIGITMHIFLFLSSLEARHVIFLCEGHHFVFWGWSSCRQSCI